MRHGRELQLSQKMFAALLFMAVFCVAAMMWYTFATFERFYRIDRREYLEAVTKLLSRDFAEASPDPVQLQRLAAASATLAHTRVTLIDPAGVVLVDTEEDPARMVNHKDRPEIRAALAGDPGFAVRFSDTRQRMMMYVAVPVLRAGRPVAVARSAVELRAVEDILWGVRQHTLVVAVLLLFLAGVTSSWVARRFSHSLEDVTRAAERFAGGDFSRLAPPADTVETRRLSQTLNFMAVQLSHRIRTSERLLGEQKAVFDGMLEGVLVLDPEGKLADLNAAAARMLDIHAERARGRDLLEAVRNVHLQDLVERTRKGPGAVEDFLSVGIGKPRHLQVHGTRFADAQGRPLGVLVVLSDVTQLRQLEEIRRDFVANVSHELKTPVTAIQGFTETLLACPDESPAERRRFLEIILRQSHRLGSLIDDILALARLEQADEHRGADRSPHDAGHVVRVAVQALAPKAEARKIGIDVECPEGLTATVDAPLLERALVNLLDNAVNYSPEGRRVAIRCRRDGGQLLFEVEDRGCGIAPEHLGRIFERFYRVDQARSRALGGTGLGLAIVKHIARLHGGTVAVRSAPGQGSTFTIAIPAA